MKKGPLESDWWKQKTTVWLNFWLEFTVIKKHTQFAKKLLIPYKINDKITALWQQIYGSWTLCSVNLQTEKQYRLMTNFAFLETSAINI